MKRFRHTDRPFYEAALADFSGAVDRLQDGDLLYLRSAWADGDGPARDAAWSEVSKAIDSSDRAGDGEALETGLARWAGSAGRSLGYITWVGQPGVGMESDLRRQALPALWDAGRAILASDLISREAYAVLIEPWRSLFEPPGSDDQTDAGEGAAGSKRAAER